MPSDQFIVGLDLGSFYIKASAITGRNGDIVFSTYGESSGIEDGKVTDSVRLLSAVKSVIRKLEMKTGSQVTSAFLNVDTAYTRQEANRGSTTLKGDVVAESDMVAAIKNAMSLVKGSDERFCDILVSDYKVDGVSFPNPIGVEGKLLDVNAQAILVDQALLEGIQEVLTTAGIKVLGTGLSCHGMANLMLTRSQRYKGCLLVDVGHRKTDLVVMNNNRLVYSETIPLGGRNITKDISIVMKVPMAEAERLKQDFGTGKLLASHPKYELLRDIILARLEEIQGKVLEAFGEYKEASGISNALVYGGGACGFKSIQRDLEAPQGLSTNYLTSDIMKSDDVFSLNATGCGYNMVHELQSGLIAQLYEDASQSEEAVEADQEYFSVFDRIRHKAKRSVKDLFQPDEDAFNYSDKEDQGSREIKRETKSREDFHKKDQEETFSAKLKKLFGIE